MAVENLLTQHIYSFDRPLAPYADYIHTIGGDADSLTSFAERHAKNVGFNPVNLWIASRTGINRKDTIAPNEPSLYIGDASGNSYGFPYCLQNDLIALIDRNDTNGLLSAIKDKRELKPFNWMQLSGVSILTGFIFSIFGSNTLHWTDKEIKQFKGLISLVDKNKIMGVFLPYYLTPDSGEVIAKNYVASILHYYNQFQVGVLVLYKKGQYDKPLALLPDVDFMYHIDLRSFSGLRFGQLQKTYISMFKKDTTFEKTHKHCDGPRPEAIELYKNIEPKLKQQSNNINQDFNNFQGGTSLKLTKESTIEGVLPDIPVEIDTISNEYVKLSFKDKLNHIIELLLMSKHSGFIFYDHKISEEDNKYIIKLVCNILGLTEAKKTPKIFLDNIFANDNFKVKQNYKITFNIIAEEQQGSEYEFKTCLALYNDAKENIQVSEVKLSEDSLCNLYKNPDRFINTLLGDTLKQLIIEDFLTSFDCKVGIVVSKWLSKINALLDFNVQVESLEVNASEYKVNFSEYLNYLSIVGGENNDLKYTLVYDASLIPVEDDKEAEGDDYLVGYLSYTGNSDVSIAIENLFKQFTNFL